MFPPMLADEERDAEGNITKAGQEYYLKAMNCPMHNLIFRSRGRSYRDCRCACSKWATTTATKSPAWCTA